MASSEGERATPSQQKVAMLRLMSDMKQMQADPPSGCSASPVSDDNLFVWNATIIGPDESPWEGGIYTLRLQFPDQYPDKPPRARFITEMFHPNIFPDGTLCLDIIQDKWKPIYTVSTILTSIQSLLCDPNNDSPANVDAAKMLKTAPKDYKKRVRRLAQKSVEG
jgi:ubiquitin-conjugating enzyme E2 A